MQGTTMWLVLFLAGAGIRSAGAQSPPPDNSPGFFSGEWTGTGPQGSYCYVNLKADGSGLVLIDGGAGDWSSARIRWQNRQQSLQVDKSVPVRASPQRRLWPLERFELRSDFNESLSLTWIAPTGRCHLQRIESTARRLNRARSAIKDLPPSDGAQ